MRLAHYRSLVPPGEGSRVPFEIAVTLERTDQGVVAYNSDVRVTASGVSEAEALQNFHEALQMLMATFGSEVIAELQKRRYVMVKVP